MSKAGEAELLAHRIYHLLGKPITKEAMAEGIKRGMIPKVELKNGKTYKGYCRNAQEATWNALTENFHYVRTKFNYTFPETIKHPEDDTGFDIFVPTLELEDG